MALLIERDSKARNAGYARADEQMIAGLVAQLEHVYAYSFGVKGGIEEPEKTPSKLFLLGGNGPVFFVLLHYDSNQDEEGG